MCGFAGTTGAVMPPVFLTSTFASGNPDGFDYTRSGNPNFRLLQQSAAALEGAQFATCFASGVSAITAVVSTLKSGDLLVAEENVYGCTYRLFDRVFAKFGLHVRYLNLAEPANWEEIHRLRPALVWLESPTNPLLKIVDIAAISQVAAAVGAPVLVDNTFASAYLQRPLELGATLSLSSTTKYVNGHSDCLGGIESLICHPPTMTHASVPRDVRLKVGIGDGLLRFSVGIEDIEDLRQDIDDALKEVIG